METKKLTALQFAKACAKAGHPAEKIAKEVRDRYNVSVGRSYELAARSIEELA